ncbi:MAG: zinc ribbon domain-containing protein [bacterium]
MPIYEFYCDPCNTIFNFFSRSVNTTSTPVCPRCKEVTLSRKLSTFAKLSNKKDDGSGEMNMPSFDEAKMEKAIGMLAREAEGIEKGDDPRQAANLMRKFSDMVGIKMGTGMEEAINRMEQGEDPEKIEAEMGDVFENEEPFSFGDGKGIGGLAKKNSVNYDSKLYEL